MKVTLGCCIPKTGWFLFTYSQNNGVRGGLIQANTCKYWQNLWYVCTATRAVDRFLLTASYCLHSWFDVLDNAVA